MVIPKNTITASRAKNCQLGIVMRPHKFNTNIKLIFLVQFHSALIVVYKYYFN